MIEDVLCNGDSTGVVAVIGSGGTPPFEYTIDGVNFQPEPSFTGLPAGNYELGVRDAEGCIVMIDATVTEPAPLIVDLGESIQINLGKEVDLQALANESPVTYAWSPTNDIIDILSADSSAIRILPLGTTDYTVTVTNEIGCTATDAITVSVFKARPIYAPTAFSPNNDGVNDGWTLFGGPDTRIIKSLKIFNRWGSLVFETEDIPLGEPSLGWDGDYLGKPMQAGVFAYIAEVEYIDDVVVLFEGDFAIVK
jgi:gliding motility-associated-like protein